MKRIITLMLGAVAVLSVSAQSDDFGIWTEVGIEKKFGKKLSLEGGVEARFEDKVTKVTRTGFNVGVTYKPWKFLHFGAGYAFMNDWKDTEVNNPKLKTDDEGNILYYDDEQQRPMHTYTLDKDYRRNKHRLYIQVVGRLSLGRFNFSLRERLQYTHFRTDSTTRLYFKDNLTTDAIEVYQLLNQPYYKLGEEYFGSPDPAETIIKQKGCKNRYYVRSRFKVAYNIKGLPLEPYASIELSNSLHEGFAVKKYRYTVGADYTIKKTHQFGLAYIYNNGVDDDNEGDLHAINLSYKFKF